MRNVSVIVTVRNEEKTIQGLLEALDKQTQHPSEVIIIDAASPDNTVSIIQRFSQSHSQFAVLVDSFPCNRSTGRNAAIHRASSELIAITDAGCLPTSTWIEELLKAYEGQAAVDPVLAGYAIALPQTEFQRAVTPYLLVMPDKVNPSTYLPATRSMLISKTNWQKVGGFDESLNTSEDFIFANRIKEQNIPIQFTQEAVVHWTPPTTLSAVTKTFVSFAAADIRGRVLRPKVLALFGRYLLGVFFFTWLFLVAHTGASFVLLCLAVGVYLWWSVQKNLKYVGSAWYWLPILQLTADFAVMAGSVWGAYQLYTKKNEVRQPI